MENRQKNISDCRDMLEEMTTDFRKNVLRPYEEARSCIVSGWNDEAGELFRQKIDMEQSRLLALCGRIEKAALIADTAEKKVCECNEYG